MMTTEHATRARRWAANAFDPTNVTTRFFDAHDHTRHARLEDPMTDLNPQLEPCGCPREGRPDGRGWHRDTCRARAIELDQPHAFAARARRWADNCFGLSPGVAVRFFDAHDHTLVLSEDAENGYAFLTRFDVRGITDLGEFDWDGFNAADWVTA